MCHQVIHIILRILFLLLYNHELQTGFHLHQLLKPNVGEDGKALNILEYPKYCLNLEKSDSL